MNQNIILSVFLILVILYAIYSFESSSNSLSKVHKLDKKTTITGTYINETRTTLPAYTHTFTLFLKTPEPNSNEHTIGFGAGAGDLSQAKNIIITRGAKTNDINSEGCFLIYYNNTHGLTVAIKNEHDGSIVNNVVEPSYNIISYTIPLQKWISVAVTVNTFSIDLFINGYLVNSGTFKHKNTTETTLYGQAIDIGDDNPYCHAWITNYTYHDKILSVEQIQTITNTFNNSYNTKTKDIYGANVVLTKGDDELGRLSF